MKRLASLATASLFLAIGLSSARAQQNLYWDTNGATPGFYTPPAFADGTWDTTASAWNTDPTGGGAGSLVVWNDAASPRDNAIFLVDGASDNDLINPDGAVTVAAGTRNVGTMTIGNGTTDKGWIALTSGGSINVGTGLVINNGSHLSMEAVGVPAVPAYTGVIQMGANPTTIKQGATLSFPNQAQITATAGQTVTFDGGTMRNTIIGVGSTFYVAGIATRWELTSNGGTVNTPNGNGTDTINSTYSIMQYGSVAGPSIVALSPGTTAGTLHKTGHGEFRASKDWSMTGVDVQQGLYRISNSTTNGGESGFGAANGTVTVAGGAVANTTNGAALGTTANLTDDVGGTNPGVGSSPATRSFVLSGVGDTPDSMVVLNNNWLIKGTISGPGGLMLNGWARNDGAGAPNIIGTENELRLAGSNTYAGATTINFGTIIASGGSAIPNTSRVNVSTQSDWGVAAAIAANHRTFNVAVLQANDSETVGSLAGGNSTRGSVNINGAGVTLTTGADNTSSTFSGSITGAGGLTKSGTGTFTMDGVKSYTGNTAVTAGTLSTNSASLADAADVLLSTGSIFNLNFAATDTIRSLFIDGTSQATGTWGGTGSGAAHISPLLTGTGLLNVTTLVSGGVPGDYNNDGKVDAADYVTWRKNPAGNGGDPAGYITWRQNFGLPGSGSGSALGGAAVPEPCGLVMLLVGVATAAVCRRPSSSR